MRGDVFSLVESDDIKMILCFSQETERKGRFSLNRSYASRPLALILAAIMIFCIVAMTSIATPVTTYANSGSSGGGGGGSSSGGSSSSGSGMIGSSGSNSINFSAIPIGQKLGGGTIGLGSTASSGSSVGTANATKATATAAASAVKQAVATGADKANVRVAFANVKELSTDVLSSVAKAAVNAGKGMDVSVVVNADTVDPKTGAVAARMSVDVAKALQSGQDINTTIEVGSASKTNVAVKEHLEKYFENTVETVTFGQKGSFGMDVPVAVKADLSGLNTDSLHFYSYDVATNQYSEVQAEYSIDNNGYLHFTTPVGNSIAITDAPLKAK